MVFRHHQHEAVAAERVGVQAAVVDGAGDDADVAGALGDQADDLVRQPLLQVDADVGIGGEERAQRLGQEFGERVGVRQHPHLAGEPARIGRQVFVEALGLRQDRARVLQQRAPGLRRRDALPSAHQQFGAEAELHLADAGRRRGQRQVRARGAMGDAARFHDVAEKIEVGQIKAHGVCPSFLFCEGCLRRKRIAQGIITGQVSYLKK